MPDEKVGESAGISSEVRDPKDNRSGHLERANTLMALVGTFLTTVSILAGGVWFFQSELRKFDQKIEALKERQKKYWYVFQDIRKQIEDIDEIRLQEFSDRCSNMVGLWDPNQKSCKLGGGRPERFQPLVFTKYVWDDAEPPKDSP